WALVSVEIEGQLDGIPALLPQELVVHVDGRPAHVVSLTTAGPFSVSVPLSSDGALGELREMSLVPKRTFCPLEHGLSADHRDLSVQLLRVRVRTRDGREIVKTLGAEAVRSGE